MEELEKIVLGNELVKIYTESLTMLCLLSYQEAKALREEDYIAVSNAKKGIDQYIRKQSLYMFEYAVNSNFYDIELEQFQEGFNIPYNLYLAVFQHIDLQNENMPSQEEALVYGGMVSFNNL